MGFGLHKFVGKVDPNLICSICVGVLENAVTTICGHSFCEDCLDTWLDRPQARSCPSCRAHVLRVDLIPVHALRGIVDGQVVHCDNSENGCEMVMKLEKLKIHLESCPHSMVECKACHCEVKRIELVDHHEQCTVLQALAAKTKDELSTEAAKGRGMGLYTQMIAELKIDLQTTKSKLIESENEVSRVSRQLKRMKLRMQIDDEEVDPDWDPDYSYGYSPSSIAHLSGIISKYLLSKPYYVDRNRVFNAVKRCHDYYHSYASYCQDVHMLLATAYASNWFTENQRNNFECWLNNLTRQIFLL